MTARPARIAGRGTPACRSSRLRPCGCTGEPCPSGQPVVGVFDVAGVIMSSSISLLIITACCPISDSIEQGGHVVPGLHGVISHRPLASSRSGRRASPKRRCLPGWRTSSLVQGFAGETDRVSPTTTPTVRSSRERTDADRRVGNLQSPSRKAVDAAGQRLTGRAENLRKSNMQSFRKSNPIGKLRR